MEHDMLFTFIGGDRRMRWAEDEIWSAGYDTAPWPSEGCTHMVLPLPAFQGENITGGPPLLQLLPALSPEVTVLGGKLGVHRAELQATGAKVIDYYLDEGLIAANADITAEGAIHLAASRLSAALAGMPVLICGWGRIGQLLAHKLRALGARVTVSARKERDLGLIEALGFIPMITGDTRRLSAFRVIFNTIDAPVYSRDALLLTREDCLLIELASTPGLEAAPSRLVVSGAGLPGLYAPETAGRLIGRTVLRLVETPTVDIPSSSKVPER